MFHLKSILPEEVSVARALKDEILVWGVLDVVDDLALMSD